ncbi:alpha/beta hydrolase [Nocardia sp. NBC_00881]|uniref:alpha/beta fold hydrolase n=1 Tax=Nocardia sp. NBC_00881 TaxID=2975995 RepID=UPI00386F64C4|nr:alpha/beta hydrolase [Nocardia sp. NBC_00881]
MDSTSGRPDNQTSPQRDDSRRTPSIREAEIDTAVAHFHYAQAGTGPPVLLLPGSGGWKLTLTDLTAALARRHTVYALDPPGQGLTRIHDRSTRFGTDAVADSIRTFLDAVGIRRAAIVGHSWGGGFALRFAQLHPERLTRLALIAPGGLDVADRWEFRLLRLPVLGEIGVHLISTASVRHMIRKSFANRDRIPDNLIQDYVRMMRQAPGRAERLADLLRVERSVRWSDTERDLSSVDAPVLLLWGSEDRYFPVRLMQRFTARLPHVQAHLLPGGGHSLHDDLPDATMQRLRPFLSADLG